MLRTRFSFAKAVTGYRAFSGFSGNAYPGTVNERLAKAGFKSSLWLSGAQVEQLGLTVAAGQKGIPLTSAQGKNYDVFNQEQLTNPDKLTELKGRGAVFNAFTGSQLKQEVAAKLRAVQLGSNLSNKWLTAGQLKSLEFTPKSGATSVKHTFLSKDNKEVTAEYYNINDLQESATAEKLGDLFPISASSGKPYSDKIALVLLKAALANGFTSQYWITLAGAQSLGLTVKDANKGTPIQAMQDKEIIMFNADQTSDPEKVTKSGLKARFIPRSAISGMPYPEPAGSALAAVSNRNKFRSVYWLTEKQAGLLGATVRGLPTEVETQDGRILVFNASQTDSLEAIEKKWN